MDAANEKPRGSVFRIEGAGNGVKVIGLTGPKAKRLADLSLHRLDLEFAAACLDQINAIPPEPAIVPQALWRSAIVHYIKCFGDAGSRFRIEAEAVYGRAPVAIDNFRYFRNLRNKHFVHDENAYAQSIPGAILADGISGHKVDRIVCFNAIAETLSQDNVSNLAALVKIARGWVSEQFHRLCEEVIKDLERESYEALASREPITYAVPEVAEIGARRKAP